MISVYLLLDYAKALGFVKMSLFLCFIAYFLEKSEVKFGKVGRKRLHLRSSKEEKLNALHPPSISEEPHPI